MLLDKFESYNLFVFVSELANQRPNKKSKNCMLMNINPDIPWSQYKATDSGTNSPLKYFT